MLRTCCNFQFFLLFFLTLHGKSQRICRTISGPSPDEKCVLPFRFNGKLHTKCPVDPEDSSKFWCSTKVDRNGQHIAKIGAYGHCSSSCPLERDQNSFARLIQSPTCLTVSGPNPNKPCVFPFNFNGKTYHGCGIDPDDGSKTWCSTKVDSKGNHIIGQNEYGHCAQNCPRDSGQVDQVSNRCLTVSGPNPGKPCIFPFKFNGKTYNDCPIDPDDKTKNWCSTKVDSGGNHVTGQNEYGHCGRNCPKSLNAGSNTISNSCSFGERCRSFATCAAQITLGNIRNCQQSEGSPGVCCKDINRNPSNNILTIRATKVGPDLSNVPRQKVDNAVDFGESFASNVSQKVRTLGRNSFGRNSPEFFHAQFLKPRKEVEKLSNLALTSATASQRLGSTDSVSFRQSGFSNTDISNTILDSGCPLEPRCSFTTRYRTMDGSCNNIIRPKYGQALTPLQRVLPNAYADKTISPRVARNGRALPSARLVSSTVTSSAPRPSRINTVLLMALGQFIDHDLTHVPMHNANGSPLDCCASQGNHFDSTQDAICFPIQIPPRDPFYRGKRTCMNFARSEGGLDIDCQPGPIQQINQITHWLDGSNIYGSSTQKSRQLRSFRGGLLKFQAAPDRGELLPRDTETECIGGLTKRCFEAGDDRVNEQPTLAVLHTLFLREHNRVARKLNQLNPGWNDEKLFQEARRIVVAEWQHIVYNEWLPIILGQQFMSRFGLFPLTQGFSNAYRNDFDPRITNAFASAAFRIGHTLVPGIIRAFSKSGSRIRNVELRKSFGNMDLLKQRNMIDGLLRGLVQEPMEIADDSFVDDITNHLFEEEQSDGIGLDLVALNIQRGRDHGIPGYIEYRKICQVGRAQNFDDLRSNISPKKIELLKRVYQSVEDIDLFIGMILEDPREPGSMVGSTFLCLIGDQFARLKWGDRFFYDIANQSGSFTLSQLTEIRKTSLSRIICDNSKDIDEIQPLALEMMDKEKNPLISCKSRLLLLGIPSVDLSQWREE